MCELRPPADESVRDELRAIEQIVESLAALNGEARLRVLLWTCMEELERSRGRALDALEDHLRSSCVLRKRPEDNRG
jgi:hypothetical protein